MPAPREVATVDVEPEDQASEYGEVPPEALTEPAPSFPPLQLTLDVTLADTMSKEGSEMVMLAVSVQPLASVTVTVYVPEDSPEAVAVEAPEDHA